MKRDGHGAPRHVTLSGAEGARLAFELRTLRQNSNRGKRSESYDEDDPSLAKVVQPKRPAIKDMFEWQGAGFVEKNRGQTPGLPIRGSSEPAKSKDKPAMKKGLPQLRPPEMFAMVEPGVFRSDLDKLKYCHGQDFLLSLNVKTIVSFCKLPDDLSSHIAQQAEAGARHIQLNSFGVIKAKKAPKLSSADAKAKKNAADAKAKKALAQQGKVPLKRDQSGGGQMGADLSGAGGAKAGDAAAAKGRGKHSYESKLLVSDENLKRVVQLLLDKRNHPVSESLKESPCRR